MIQVVLCALVISAGIQCAFCGSSCPWINTATASGIVGGAVETKFIPSAKNKDDGLCEFLHHSDSIASKLKIEVTLMSNVPKEYPVIVSKCGPQRMEVRGIGNEAVGCIGNGRSKEESEQVIGRVRDRAFVIRFESNDTSLTPLALREGARAAADQVAGSLF